MRKSDRFDAFLSHFATHQPSPETELAYGNAFELLVAVILSAQCTDKRVNLVTPALLQWFPDAQALADGDFDSVFELIKSISFAGNKSRHLLGMARRLVDVYDSQVPDSIEELQTLPGVGRKTANVIVSVIFDQPALAVDTHVFRVSKRLGLVTQTAKTPLEVEKQLVRHIPEDLIGKAHHWLILHGRYICLARKPKCDVCEITSFCRYYERNVLAVQPAENR